MNRIRQERQSCEACRARKLKCSGDKTGCSRCQSLGLACVFREKGAPGRPRKPWHQQQQQPQRASHKSAKKAQSALVPGPSGLSPPMFGDTANQRDVEDVLLELSNFPPLPADLTGTDQGFDSFSIEALGHCHLASTSDPGLSDTTLQLPLSPASSTVSCNCADEVCESVRALRRGSPSHAMLHNLRAGADLVERLLTCPICYDVTKAPRLTIQNVLLIGRLMHEITAGYHKYLHWLHESSSDPAESSERESVYLLPGLDISPPLSFAVSRQKFEQLIRHALQVDAERLAELGSKFGLRQHNRHMIGHETCPDAQGRCWRETYDLDNDPLDICPQNSAARTLTPCYRVVDEIQASIKRFADAVA